jgi:hypothetical protein
MGQQNELADWGIAKRILFRFTFVYLIVYLLPFPLNYIPYVSVTVRPYFEFWNAVVPWVGEHVFQVTSKPLITGSGDSTYHFVQLFCYLTLAVTVTVVWSLLDRKRPSYPRLYDWMRVYVRFGLASIMMHYGAVKVIKSQFPYPTLDRLLQPFGDASPMGLLWTFMGASASYNVFAGAGEMLGGLLLTTRRTTLLGALVSAGVLSNVVMLNFSYDVPVKQYSLHLFAMALFLAAPDLRRLANLFLLNRAVEPVDLRPHLRWTWLRRGVLVLRTVLVVAFAFMVLYGAQQSRQTFGDRSPRSPLQGIWSVEEFEVDGKVRPPLMTDATRWRRVVFDYPGMIAIQLMSDSRNRYRLKLDTGQHTLALTKRDNPDWKSDFSYQQPEPELLKLEGTLDGQKIRAKLRRVEESSFLLVTRGFHWISEYPFNR